MDALRKSVESSKGKAPAAAPAKPAKGKKKVAGQREMLLPISGSGQRAARQEPKQDPKQGLKKAEKPARAPARSKKAG